MFLDSEAIFNTLFVRQHPSEGGKAEDVCQQTQWVQLLTRIDPGVGREIILPSSRTGRGPAAS